MAARTNGGVTPKKAKRAVAKPLKACVSWTLIVEQPDGSLAEVVTNEMTVGVQEWAEFAATAVEQVTSTLQQQLDSIPPA